MTDTQQLLDSIKNGIQDKKGEKITIADLTGIEDTACSYFVICQGGSPSQLLAIADSIRETARVEAGVKPSYVEGTRYAHWVAMDYGEIMVHIFVPELRQFYDMEHLWADAKLTEIPDLD